MSQAACQIILQDPEVSAAKATAMTVADDVEYHGGQCPETVLQQVADVWLEAAKSSDSLLSGYL